MSQSLIRINLQSLMNVGFGLQDQFNNYFSPFSEHLSDHNSLYASVILKSLTYFTPR